MARSYAKIFTTIIHAQQQQQTSSSSSQPSGSGSGSGSGNDPQQLWTGFRMIVSKLHDYLSSARSDSVKYAVLRLMEEQMLFALPNSQSNTQSSNALAMDPRLSRKMGSDPRLARVSSSSSSSAAGNTTDGSIRVGADEIPLHHPFINKNEIQREAEDYFAKALLWMGKQGPQAFPFSPSLLGRLAQVVATIGTLRPALHGVNAAKAVAFLISNKSQIIQEMSKNDREHLARAAHRLLRATTVYTADPEQNMQKLKDAVNSLDITTEEGLSGNKRSLDEVEDGEETAEELQARRELVLQALETAENTRKQSSTLHPDEALQGGSGGSGLDPGLAVAVSESSDLSAAILPIAKLNLGSKSKLVVIPSTASGAVDLSPKPLMIASGEEYEEISLLALLQLLEHYMVMVERGTKTFLAYAEVMIRTVLSLSISHCQEEEKVNVRVAILQSFAAGLLPADKEDVPIIMMLPKPLWLFLSFLFTVLTSGDMLSTRANANYVNDAMTDFSSAGQAGHVLTLLNKLLIKLYSMTMNDEDVENGSIAKTLYSAVVVVSLSRFLQHVDLRHLAKEFLLDLPFLPPQALRLLFLLMQSGSKNLPNSLTKAQAHRVKTVRAEALALVGVLVFSNDEMCGKACLYHILACAICDDLELRSHSIGLLVNDLIHIEPWVDEIVFHFAILVALEAVGYDAVETWLTKQSSKMIEKKEEVNDDMEVVEEENVKDLTKEKNGESDIPHPEIEQEAVIQEEKMEFSFIVFQNMSPDQREPLQECLQSRKSPDESLESRVKRTFHLLAQLSLVEIQLLRIFVEVYSVDCMKKTVHTDESSSSTTTEAAAPSTDSNPPQPVKESWNLDVQIRHDLRSIIPAYLSHHATSRHQVINDQSSIPDVEIFRALHSVQDTAARPLLTYALQLILHDHHQPPKTALMDLVLGYLRKEDSGLQALESSQSSALLTSITDDANFAMAMTIIGGLPAAAIEAALPRIIALYADDGEGLKVVFSRITKARPPPITKSVLLIHLHRIDIEATGLKTKNVLDAIALCLNNKADFNGEVIKETLRVLAEDAVPVVAIMRTAILGAQAFAEVKKFVLNDVVPIMIRKQVWSSAPKVWEGVLYAIKTLGASGQKQAEPSLLSLFAIPGIQLKALFKIAPPVKPLMAKLLQAMTVEERDRALSAQSDSTKDGEKLKLVKELTTMALTT
eukprot:scaffold11522_cov239-Ochromonas_danica.AAC.1